MIEPLTGVAVVTGGSAGIGQAVCLRLAQAGARGIVVNYATDEGVAMATVAKLKALGCEAIAHRADVADDSECRGLIDAAVTQFGAVDIVVNNAGVTENIPYQNLDEVTDRVWERVFGVNVKGAFQCTRAAVPSLRTCVERIGRRGAVVNVSSMSGWRVTGSSIPYGVSKAALLHLTRFLAEALAPDVRVNSVSPGLVSTDWVRKRFGPATADQREHERAALTPLHAIAQPDDVAQAVLGMLTMNFVTGEDIRVEGGLHLRYGPRLTKQAPSRELKAVTAPDDTQPSLPRHADRAEPRAKRSFRGAINNTATVAGLLETLLQIAACVGVPAALESFRVVEKVP